MRVVVSRAQAGHLPGARITNQATQAELSPTDPGVSFCEVGSIFMHTAFWIFIVHALSASLLFVRPLRHATIVPNIYVKNCMRFSQHKKRHRSSVVASG